MLTKTRRLLDFVYPANCHTCQCKLTHGSHLCESCKNKLPFVEAPYCSRCGECYDGEISSGFICPNCHDLTLDFEFARAALRSEGDARDLLHDFKYRRKIHLADELGQLLEAGLEDSRFKPYSTGGILIPVPLHWARLRTRKFNQAAEMAASLAKISGLSMLDALKRNRNTGSQTRFNRGTRLENLRGAFELRKKYQDLVRDKKIILVDDVFTTGATANECTKVLLEHGAQCVAILTLLRG